jgi:RNA polymerase sigma-70 factor (ECF subfamily)
MASDEDLVAAVALGSESAFSELLGRHERPLAGFLRRQLGDADAEDVFQEVWLRVARGAPGFDVSRRFKPWLYGIALNEMRDWLARRGRARELPLEGADVPDPKSGTTAAHVDVERLLSILPLEQRDVLILRYQLDLSEAEIAEALGVPRGTVKSRSHAALARLAEWVKPKEG